MLEFTKGQAVGHNLFAYCADNPMSYSDPSGTCLHHLTFWKDCELCARLKSGNVSSGLPLKMKIKLSSAAAANSIIQTGSKITLVSTAIAAVGTCFAVSSPIYSSIHVGTSFGKLGTLIRYKKITINWSRTTTHMLNRMAERGMSKSLINSVVKEGKMLKQGTDKYLYISKKGAVVMDGKGTLITGYGSRYFDATMKWVVKLLLG